MSRTPHRSRAVVAIPFAWMAFLFLAPLGIVAKISLSEPALSQPPYRPHWEPSLDPTAWREALGGLGFQNYVMLASDELYWRAAGASLAVAALSTGILLLVGFPVALAMARAAPRWRPVLVALVIVPFWTSFLIRVYAWTAILRPEGWLHVLLSGLGLTDAPLGILNTSTAVVLGAVYAYLPFMILPLFASLERQDPALLEAAADLGASALRRFWSVTVPLAAPGTAAGTLLCFVPIFGEFIIPDLLGGPDTLMLGRALWSEFFANRDWPLASAVAIVTLLALLGPILLFRHEEARRLERRG